MATSSGSRKAPAASVVCCFQETLNITLSLPSKVDSVERARLRHKQEAVMAVFNQPIGDERSRWQRDSVGMTEQGDLGQAGVHKAVFSFHCSIYFIEAFEYKLCHLESRNYMTRRTVRRTV